MGLIYSIDFTVQTTSIFLTLKLFKAWVRNVNQHYGWTAISLVIFVLPS